MAEDLGSFNKSSWIVTAYLMTYSGVCLPPFAILLPQLIPYTGFLLVFARLSDFIGRKLALLIALAFFLVWSLACALAQTVEQL